MAISKEEVLKVANLGRIELTPEEVELFSKQLESVLEYIDQLKGALISDGEDINYGLNIQSALRADIPQTSLPVDDALRNAPQKQKGHFQVPKVIE